MYYSFSVKRYLMTIRLVARQSKSSIEFMITYVSIGHPTFVNNEPYRKLCMHAQDNILQLCGSSDFKKIHEGYKKLLLTSKIK